MALALNPVLVGAPRVNLMPRSELDRRGRDRLIRGWVWGILGAIVAALLIIAVAFSLKWSADQRLAGEHARTNELLVEVASLAPVSQALATERELTEFRSLAMAADLAWAPVVARVVGVLPPLTELTGFNVTSGGVPAGDDATMEPGLTGTFSVESATALDITGIIRSLRAVDGVLYADGQSVTASTVVEGRFAYLVTVTFDQTVYSGAFATETEEED